MAYQKQKFIDDETVLTAEIMGHIEDGIVQNETDIKNKADLDESGRLNIEQLPEIALTNESLTSAINTALAQAKESGDFDGQDGYTPIKGVDYFDGAKGEKGDKGDKGDTGADGYTPIKSTDYFTESDKAEMVAMVIESLGGNPVFGYVNKNNSIILSGNLADGDYTVKYEMEDGTTIDIGQLVLDNNVYYSVTSNLTNCTNSNSETQAIGGESYTATIAANSGYELSSVVVTMGGVDISDSVVSDGSISIASVTGNIVITAVAATNFIEYNSTNTTDWSIWINNARIGSDGTHREDTSVSGGPAVVSNYIAVQNGDIVEFEGFYTTAKSAAVYNAEKAVLTTGAGTLASLTTYLADVTEGTAGTYAGQFTINNASVAYVRIGGYIDPNSFPMSIKIKRNGEYL